MALNHATLMSSFRFLVVSLLVSAFVAPLTAQTTQEIKQLPGDCVYLRVPRWENAFPYRPQKDGINLTHVVTPPQFLIHSLPSLDRHMLPMPLFAKPPDGLTVVCGLHNKGWVKEF